jgi:hypothetical protein
MKFLAWREELAKNQSLKTLRWDSTDDFIDIEYDPQHQHFTESII